MATVLFALRKTTTDALASVSATTGAITHSVTALSDFAGAGAAHAASYRRTTEAGLLAAEAELTLAGEQQAKLNVARKLLTIQQELSADPELTAIYKQIGDSLKPQVKAVA